MKKEIIFILLAIALIFFISKAKLKISTPMVSKKDKAFTPEDAKTAILAVKQKYGDQMAKDVERIFRLETAHFKSSQYQKTGSAGMEAGKWKNLPPELIEPYTVDMHDADKSDGIDKFIVWKSPTAFAIYLAEYIKRYNGNWARWNTTDPQKQAKYRAVVNTIIPKFVV